MKKTNSNITKKFDMEQRERRDIARIGFFGRAKEYEVYVKTDDECQEPHFHVRDIYTETDTAICLLSNHYSKEIPCIWEERQSNELTNLTNSKGWKLEATFAEKISGAKKDTERKELMKMVEYVKTHNISKVLVTELSRLGRDTLQVLQVIELLNKEGISLYIQNYNIETLTEEGKINPCPRFSMKYDYRRNRVMDYKEYNRKIYEKMLAKNPALNELVVGLGLMPENE